MDYFMTITYTMNGKFIVEVHGKSLLLGGEIRAFDSLQEVFEFADTFFPTSVTKKV